MSALATRFPSVREAEHALFVRQTFYASDAPRTWLDPRAGVIAAQPRAETEVLERWCRTALAPALRLVCAPGGQGKTVLAAQLCERMRHGGWLAGFCSIWQDGAAGGCDALHAARDIDVQGVLVVVDYAEQGPDALRRLLNAAVATAT